MVLVGRGDGGLGRDACGGCEAVSGALGVGERVTGIGGEVMRG